MTHNESMQTSSHSATLFRTMPPAHAHAAHTLVFATPRHAHAQTYTQRHPEPPQHSNTHTRATQRTPHTLRTSCHTLHTLTPTLKDATAAHTRLPQQPPERLHWGTAAHTHSHTHFDPMLISDTASKNNPCQLADPCARSLHFTSDRPRSSSSVLYTSQNVLHQVRLA